MFTLLFGIVALIAGPLAVVAIDKKLRNNQVFEGYEVSWSLVVALTFLINIAALPYYFARTRGSMRLVPVGLGLWAVCVVVFAGASFGGAMVDQSMSARRMHQRGAAAAAANEIVPEIEIDLPPIDQSDRASR